MGTSSYLISNSDQDDVGVVGYFPLIAVSVIAVAYHIGLGPIPWSYSGTYSSGLLHKIFSNNKLNSGSCTGWSKWILLRKLKCSIFF